MKIQRVPQTLGRLHDLEPLGIRLHHAIFDTIMDHLNEVPRADWPTIGITILWRKRQERRFQSFDHIWIAADHQTEAHLQTPNAARRSLINIVNLMRLEHVGTALIIVKISVTAIDD